MKRRKNASVRLVCAVLLSCLVPLHAQPPIEPSPFWKNAITFPDDPFRVSGASADDPGWLKFTILLPPYDPNIVYFQDSKQYPFHYHFATELLAPFIGMTPQQYDQVTLYAQGRRAVLGAVVLPPTGGYPAPMPRAEYGIQFVGQDAYAPPEIVAMFNVVKAAVAAEPNVTAFYFPTYEQLAVAQANRQWFESQGIPVGSVSRWAEGNAVYSSGWALGRLKYFEGHNIAWAYLSGQLEPNDILLTDGVPAEAPFLAGIITLSPSTPNSHVAILCTNYRVPFVHLALAEDAGRAEQLVGRRIVLRAFEGYFANDVRLIDVQETLDEATIPEILALKQPPPLNISPMTPCVADSMPADNLMPSHIRYCGGKAANFGILRTSIPENSPVAVAFSFNLWNGFLDQQLFTGRTLREEINQRLSDYTYPPADMWALSDDLDDVRDLFTNTYATAFTNAQQNAVTGTLQDPSYAFDPLKKIRFRSSTNVEDSNQTTFAGLFDSYSGCLADDLDPDSSGPCRCDPDESRERGVFRAIRKVFASFYNDNAFLERLRYDVNEADVGMALLVHHSFPDEIELANGVATVKKTYTTSWDIKLVTQHGATPVTNPEDGSIPEEVTVYVYSSKAYPSLVRQSNLVPLGATVLDWQQDYLELTDLLVAVGQRWAEVTGKHDALLDLEYKKVAPDGKLVIKQVREVPQPDRTQSVTPFLINEPAQLCTFQGEYGDVFANHRLKSRWLIETKSLWLTKENLADTLYTTLSLEYVAAGRVRRISGNIAELPKAAYLYDGTNTIDTWLMHHLPNPRTCKLRTEQIPSRVTPADNPMLTLIDIPWLSLEADYQKPVPTWTWQGPGTTTTDSIRLYPCPTPQPGDKLQSRIFRSGKNIVITTSFYWPPEPKGPVAGYTAPLVRWVETTIEGYTAGPLILHGWYSQTYRPEHHNFGENFLFEPQLEPGISQETLDELRAKDIRLIHVRAGFQDPVITTLGFDETPFLSGDIDKDNDVDFKDLDALTARWLDTACDDCGRADLTGDGKVNLADYQDLAANWLDTIK